MKTCWQIKKIGEICDLATGGTPSRTNFEYFRNGTIRWLVSGDINKREIFDCDGRITEKGMRNSNAKILPINSVMIALNGQGKTRGTVAMLRTEATCNQSLVSIFPKNTKEVIPEYIYRNLEGRYAEIRKITGDNGNDRRGLNMSLIRGLEIPLPTISEQKRIVKTLDEVFEKVTKAKEAAEKNLQNSRELFESYLQNVFANPAKDWEEKTLGEVYDVRDGTHDSPRYQKEGYALVTSKNLKRDLLNFDKIKYISETDYKKINERSKVDKGDILFAMIGTIGNPVVVQDEPDFAIKNVALFKIPNDQDGLFLKYFLDSKFVINKMMSEAKGTTQKFVGLGYLRTFKVAVPSIKEQKVIVKKLQALSIETRKLEKIYEQKLADLEELKKSILSKAFHAEL